MPIYAIKPFFFLLQELGTVFALETCHVLGVSLMFFGALPGADSTLALTSTAGVALLPATLRALGGGGQVCWCCRLCFP